MNGKSCTLTDICKYVLGCGSPVSYLFVYAISADIRVEANEGRLARQRREFKTYRKSTAQVVISVVDDVVGSTQRGKSVRGATRPRTDRETVKEGGLHGSALRIHAPALVVVETQSPIPDLGGRSRYRK